jgi:predicted dienelactone hydrolase
MSTLDLYDSKRDRKIPVDIYWSNAATQDKPLIIFSHGLGSVRSDLQYLAQHLASHGYVVAALEHPGSNEANTNAAFGGNTSLLKPQEFIERPKDISFILDELTKVNQNNASLQGKLGTNNAMVIGYSFGGSTALSVAGAELQPHWMSKRCKDDVISFSLGEGIQCISAALPDDKYQLREPRIKSAIALNPVASLMFGDTGVSKVEIPTLIWGGSADKTAPALTEQVIPFTKITTPKWLVGVVGGTHLSVKDPTKTMDQKGKPNTPIAGEEVVGEKAVAVREYVKAVSLAMAAQMTPDAEKYAVFLSLEYAQLASKDGFEFRIVRDLPPEAKAVVDSFIKEN